MAKLVYNVDQNSEEKRKVYEERRFFKVYVKEKIFRRFLNNKDVDVKEVPEGSVFVGIFGDDDEKVGFWMSHPSYPSLGDDDDVPIIDLT